MIHSAVHAARPDLKAVLRTHTTTGAAVSAQRDGLLKERAPMSRHDGRQIRLGLFVLHAGYHLAGWRHPEARSGGDRYRPERIGVVGPWLSRVP